MRDRVLLAGGLLASGAVAVLLLAPRLLHPPAHVSHVPSVAFEPPAMGPLAAPASASPSSSASASAKAAERPEACPSDMVYVHGAFCPFVAHKCKKRKKDSSTCDEFAPEVLCEGTIRESRACIDKLEYPNLPGVKPAVLVTYGEARHACETEGKRLCNVDEWQFACEGEAIRPLPEGIRRDGGCNVDRADLPPLFGTLHSPFEFAKELMRVDGRATAGEREACASAFGVRDLAGNVGEWTENPLGGDNVPPFRSAIAGGSFGPLEASCRTLDTTTPDNVRSHRTGFRCCVDAGARAPNERPIPSKRSPGGFRPIPMPRPGLP